MTHERHQIFIESYQQANGYNLKIALHQYIFTIKQQFDLNMSSQHLEYHYNMKTQKSTFVNPLPENWTTADKPNRTR